MSPTPIPGLEPRREPNLRPVVDVQEEKTQAPNFVAQRNVKGQVRFHWDLLQDSVDFEESVLRHRKALENVFQR